MMQDKNIWWGKLSDVVGRRPILLSSNATLMISMVLIGFSFSFPWTVCVLFLEGLFNGTVVVAKTYLYEVCPPEYHSLAFSIFLVPSNVAQFVGPTLGGFLSCPATRFEVFDIPLFKQFPYLLPCAVVACLQFCILIVGCLFLTESLGKKLKEEYIDLTEVSTDSEEDGEKRQEDSITGILRDRLVLTSCVVYAIFALASICINQTLLALLLVSDPDHGGYSFGPAEVSVVLTTIAVYGTVTKASINPYIASKFTYKTVYVIGLVLYAVGISLLPSMSGITGVGAVASRKLSNKTASSSDFTLNFTTAERISTTSPQVMTEGYLQKAAEMNVTAARPLPGQCRIADGDKTETSQPPASDLLARVWAPLLFVVLVMEQGRAFSFLAGMVLVGNASVQSNRGTINSIAQILASLMRLAGPVTSANLFAWSNDNGLPWPLDHHLGFYVVAVLCLLMAVLCASLPASINKPRIALDSPTASEGSDGGKGQGK
ncbi:PREDICTED: probable peptide/nitrate transporter At3g43790 [Branchiostoma belcheri]|uniref:Probable peptide/nitrate transporter At3g43790 n=1 Tax=Branchiostoma belcheri TaxID=7741 RepID=A0A6P4ZS87_BRABE|nr:PREDICTED: probable peptide/nitrate transporter At3g43790 [Branchiostoma belcheri]